MSCRIRPPEETRLELSRGDWIVVKKHLTAGETRQMFTRMTKTMVAGKDIELEPQQAGLTQIVGYLLDWSFDGLDGKRIVIRDKAPEVVEAALLQFDGESFNEIQEAINRHDAAMRKEREAEKNVPAGATTSPATSASAA